MMKPIYTFGEGRAEGKASMKDLLGGKGSNLAEMSLLGIPVPPGFTITTKVCTHYNTHQKKFPPTLQPEVTKGISHIENILGIGFGPYLVIDKDHTPASGEGGGSNFSWIFTATAAYRLSRHWNARVSWNRINTDYNRDTDVLLLGAGYRY